jgi:protein tyrosine phosphatase (PTP) superfamily phosphohydrolase (DUF442 family)
MALLLAGCGTTKSSTARVRPEHWAQPVLGGSVDNWFQVSPELHRCAQPTKAGMQALAAFGIRSVVNLREFHSDADEVAGTPLQLTELQLDAGELTYPQLVAALAAVVRAPKPVVVHCWQGADRTGAVVAAWRIAVQGWSAAAASDEMVAGEFGHSVLYGNLRELVAGIDRAQLRRDAGLPALP